MQRAVFLGSEAKRGRQTRLPLRVQPGCWAALADGGVLQNNAGNAVHRAALDRRLRKEVAVSAIHHAAGDGIEFNVRKQLDFASHIYLLLLDEADHPHRRTGNWARVP